MLDFVVSEIVEAFSLLFFLLLRRGVGFVFRPVPPFFLLLFVETDLEDFDLVTIIFCSVPDQKKICKQWEKHRFLVEEAECGSLDLMISCDLFRYRIDVIGINRHVGLY